MTDYRPRKLYRNTRDARVMGVCAGLADYLDVRVGVVRCLTIIGIIFSGGWLIAPYLVMGFVLDPMPEELYRPREPSRREQRREARRERWHQEKKRYWQRQESSAPDYDTRDVRRRFAEIEKRTQKMEAYMTSRKFRLDRELRGLED